MHYTRIIWGIIFISHVTIRHYDLIYIKTVGNLFAPRFSVYFCHYVVTGVTLLLDHFSKIL